MVTTLSGYVKAGFSYTFLVVAKKYIGIGPSSLKITVLAASIPDTPALPTATAQYNSYQVMWDTPNN